MQRLCDFHEGMLKLPLLGDKMHKNAREEEGLFLFSTTLA